MVLKTRNNHRARDGKEHIETLKPHSRGLDGIGTIAVLRRLVLYVDGKERESDGERKRGHNERGSRSKLTQINMSVDWIGSSARIENKREAMESVSFGLESLEEKSRELCSFWSAPENRTSASVYSGRSEV